MIHMKVLYRQFSNQKYWNICIQYFVTLHLLKII